MKKSFFLFPFLFVFFSLTAQIEKPPVYIGCENEDIQNLESCFNTNLKLTILEQFQTPQIVEKDNYKGQIRVVFIVSKEGNFEVLYVNSIYSELEDEVNRMLKRLPKIQPATYNGRPIDSRYVIPISIPLEFKNSTALSREIFISLNTLLSLITLLSAI